MRLPYGVATKVCRVSGPFLGAAIYERLAMIVSAKLNAAINAQIGHELENSNRYVAIASYFEGECLFLLSKIYFKQADEERDHAMKFVKFLLEVGGRVVIPQVPAPPSEFATAEQAAQLALDSEVRTTQEIYALVELATAEKNYIAVNFLQWFVSEQLEEISSAQARLSVIKRAGPSVLMVEAYLAHGGG
jgi:ferritin